MIFSNLLSLIHTYHADLIERHFCCRYCRLGDFDLLLGHIVPTLPQFFSSVIMGIFIVLLGGGLLFVVSYPFIGSSKK